ncbi:MAG: GTPase [Candidatus Woesearchaeota archaeon]
MPSYNALVRRVIRESDIVLIIVDIRTAMEVDLSLIRTEVQRAGKKYLYVLSKADLFDGDIKEIRLKPFITVSASKRISTRALVRKLMEIGHGEEIVVGVVGLPNAGKSTLINALKGSRAASTSPISGHTKGIQHIRISPKILLVDTPGVLAGQHPTTRLKAAAIDASKVKDAEAAASNLIGALEGAVEAHYGVETHEDTYETIEAIGQKLGMLRKGGVDMDRVSRKIIKDWQDGTIKA